MPQLSKTLCKKMVNNKVRGKRWHGKAVTAWACSSGDLGSNLDKVRFLNNQFADLQISIGVRQPHQVGF